MKKILNDFGTYLCKRVVDSTAIIADFNGFNEEINKCYLFGEKMIAHDYFLSKSAICHQEWFTKKARGLRTALIQILLIKLVVKMVEMASINMGTDNSTGQQEKTYSRFSKDELFTIFSVGGLYAFTSVLDDKARSVSTTTYPKDMMLYLISTNLDAYSSLGEGENFERYNTFMKVLLIALVSNELSRAQK
ncbi:hypothetical protein Ciccas_014374, partial [Cichlidogyrus casuarinus]